MIKPERWQPADGLKLEPNALRAATETTHSLALTAGPGAGKTEMLAQRADFLLRTGACRYPRRILAISFKVDASRNLKERVRKRCGPALASRFDSHTFHAFAKRLIDRFRPVLTGKDALDADYTIGKPRVTRRQIEFDDLVPLAIEILKASEVARNAVRQTYSHVFLDEFQDCTGQQYQLLRAAFHGSDIQLTAVGDTKQRIMGWAGALEGVFKTFAGEFKATPLNLYQNFRSQPRLRRMQNAMVKVMDPGAAVPGGDIVGKGGLVQLEHFADSQAEAAAITALIAKSVDEDALRLSEIAILVSKQVELYAQPLMSMLTQQGVAFRNEQALQDLSAEPAARLIVDFLTVVMTEQEPEAYSRLMDTLLSGAMDDDAAYEARTRWHRFIDDARTRAGMVATPGPAAPLMCELAEQLLQRAGRELVAGLSADYERGPRLDEVVEQTFARIRELRTVASDAAGALARFSEDRAVRIMTIHKSKGLEFDTVIVLGVEEEAFWGEEEAERSGFFVAISRAKRRLVLTTTSRRDKPEGANQYWRTGRTPHAEFLGYASER
ncbi:MAG: UvrD-helicase domain-containing protein [Pseudomonadota bacterium]